MTQSDIALLAFSRMKKTDKPKASKHKNNNNKYANKKG